ncbi:hypothetical protein [Azospirillum argentinense]
MYYRLLSFRTLSKKVKKSSSIYKFSIAERVGVPLGVLRKIFPMCKSLLVWVSRKLI